MNTFIGKYLNYFGIVFLICLVFILGFYFGYKNNEAKTKLETTNLDLKGTDIVTNAEDVSNRSDMNNQARLENIKEVHWIKSGEEPVCPKSHPIKGKFDTAVNLYYTKENRFYDRVKPNLCFVNEAFARDIAGFVKKF